MGGVISHTLVSTSGDRVWRSVFRVPPSELQGDPDAIRELERVLFFRRNPRVVRVIFMAAPHRGSPMADSFVGVVGNWLTRLDPMLNRGLSRLAVANTESMTPEAAAFYKGRFSAVRTLSSKSTALIAVSRLPIEVPFHSVIGQRHPGPKEQGSDGIVPYWSSHLDGAQSEVIVRSGHGVFSNPQAVQEVIRILRLASREKRINSHVFARAGRVVSPRRPRQKAVSNSKIPPSSRAENSYIRDLVPPARTDCILKSLSVRNKKGIYQAGMQNDPGALIKLEALYVSTPYPLAYNGRPSDGRLGSRPKKVRMRRNESPPFCILYLGL